MQILLTRQNGTWTPACLTVFPRTLPPTAGFGFRISTDFLRAWWQQRFSKSVRVFEIIRNHSALRLLRGVEVFLLDEVSIYNLSFNITQRLKSPVFRSMRSQTSRSQMFSHPTLP